MGGLAQSQLELVELVLNLDPERLDKSITKDGPTVYAVLHGIAQHHTYHAGQISILKKGAHT